MEADEFVGEGDAFVGGGDADAGCAGRAEEGVEGVFVGRG